jgi:hypothetical protein
MQVVPIKKEKHDLLNRLDQLDKHGKTTMLTPQEMDLKHCLKAMLVQLLHEEEIKWHQRSKAYMLLKGESNTKYFHLLANGKHESSNLRREARLLRGGGG